MNSSRITSRRLSFTPLRHTVCRPIITPAFWTIFTRWRSRGVISLGWLMWMLTICTRWLFQHGAQLGRNTRVGNCTTMREPMRKKRTCGARRADGAQNFVQPLVGEGQRVTAREQHVFNVLGC
jgi:hypothetical protein